MTIKRYEYSPLGSELKKTDIARKQYQRLEKVCEFDKREGDKTINKDDKKIFNIFSFELKYNDLVSFIQNFNELSRVKFKKKKMKRPKKKKKRRCIIKLQYCITIFLECILMNMRIFAF